MKIREESSPDFPAIAQLITAAFAAAPHSSGTEAAIVSRLRQDRDLIDALVAEAEGQLVGHVAVSAGRIGADAGWCCLGPIAVHPGHQGKGYGAALMTEALARARKRGATGMALVGDPAWYQRFGFAPQPGVTVPGIPGAYILLCPFGSARPRGVLRFAAGFGIEYPETGS